MAIREVGFNGERIIPLVGNCALVASISHPGEWHAVKNGKCDCLGFQRRAACRHLRALTAYLAREEREHAAAMANALVHVETQRDPLFLNERPAPAAREPRSFDQIFGVAS